jgi:hypothetical protein
MYSTDAVAVHANIGLYTIYVYSTDAAAVHANIGLPAPCRATAVTVTIRTAHSPD